MAPVEENILKVVLVYWRILVKFFEIKLYKLVIQH
jgi:hypothetical protein